MADIPSTFGDNIFGDTSLRCLCGSLEFRTLMGDRMLFKFNAYVYRVSYLQIPDKSL